MLFRSIVLALVIAALAFASNGAELPVAAALVAAAALALGGGAAWYARRRWVK